MIDPHAQAILNIVASKLIPSAYAAVEDALAAMEAEPCPYCGLVADDVRRAKAAALEEFRGA